MLNKFQAMKTNQLNANISAQTWAWLVIFFAVLIWSGIAPASRFTWVLEVLPALLGLLALAVAYPKFRFTPLVSVLILLHCLILMVGGHYTYAEVPLFDRLAEWMGSARNNFDKLGHFAQGFVPVLVVREIVLRRDIISKPFWVGFFSVCFCLAFSAFYELLEWWVALWVGESAEDFLGTQGYIWDTQSDMFYALIGAVLALALLSRSHDRQIEAVSPR